MYGVSYLAITQLFTAALHPPHLKAIFPILPMGDAYRDMVFPGGQNNVGFIPFWLALVSGSALIPPPYALSGNPDDLARGLELLASHALAFPGFDANFELDAMAGEGAYDGPRWKTSSPIEVVDKITVPTFIVGGLHDIFQRGEPLLYERLKNRVPTRLLIGPWTHTTVGEGLPADGVPAIDQIALRWLDNYLKGIDTDVQAIPKVTQYTFGDARYETQPDWPDPSLAPSRRYLRAGGSLATTASDPSGSAGELPPKPGLRRVHAVDEPVVGRAARAGPVHDGQPARRGERRDVHHAAARAGSATVRAALRGSLGDDDRVGRGRQRPGDGRRSGWDLERAHRRLARRLVPRARHDEEPVRRRPAAAAVASVHEGLDARRDAGRADRAAGRDLPHERRDQGRPFPADRRRPERLPARGPARVAARGARWAGSCRCCTIRSIRRM